MQREVFEQAIRLTGVIHYLSLLHRVRRIATLLQLIRDLIKDTRVLQATFLQTTHVQNVYIYLSNSVFVLRAVSRELLHFNGTCKFHVAQSFKVTAHVMCRQLSKRRVLSQFLCLWRLSRDYLSQAKLAGEINW